MTQRIGLVGFFGWGNYGDELFLRLWMQRLQAAGEPSVVHQITKSPYFIDPVATVAESYDAFVIGGGDLVIPWSISDLYWRKEWLTRPVYIAGVGVPTWGGRKDHIVNRLRAFFQHPNVRYISARDPESAAWITENLEPSVPVTWAPDLVFALDLPAVSAPAGQPILGVVTRHRKGGPDNYESVASACERAERLGYRIRQIVLGTGPVGEADAAAAGAFDWPGKELVVSEDLDVLTRAIGECGGLLSMKFHGTVVAVAYGVPSLVLSPTDKSRNLYRMIGQERLLSHLNADNLQDKIAELKTPIPDTARAELRERSAAAVQQLVDRVRDDVSSGR
ncbi:polysaccharide pyruvyl transferase family protein [Jiangella alkaliphila]|uniref:Polysaccharide pyruvyl transferase family protein WcaK n=1 Tax=Jiangella alkaliphila TaxID=419479 RepID=A0A1H2LZ87_9ACTN|nr:polysaccharide pyruvyl transferase family protein [Jiangella alkaliphila]SDU86172.1 Polysaccharide pyruvyl transferase family protein WcaK [Jiangella alkaliphila]